MNMKRSILLFPVAAILLALSVSSCRDAGVRDALQRAEALMESDPHAVRSVLDSLQIVNRTPSFARLNTSKNKQGVKKSSNRKSLALYALLRTQADYKSGEKLTSDSLIRIAVDYYGTRRKAQHAALAQYYLGCAYSDMGRDLDAIDALLRATTLFPDTTSKYFANSLFELGLLYSNHHMYGDAISVLNRYRPLPVCESDSSNIGYADYYLGRVNLFLGNYSLADSLFQRVISNTFSSEVNRRDTYFQLAKLHFYNTKDVTKASEYINTYLGFFNEEKGRGAALLLKAEILSEVHDPALASTFYRKTLKNSTDIYARCTAYKGLADASSYLGEPDTARHYLNKYFFLLDSIYSQSKQKEIAEIKDMHIVELHDQQLQARHSRFLLWGGIFFVVAFSVFAITLLLNDRKHKTEKLKFEEELRDIKQRHINQNVKEEEPEMEEENASASEPEKDVRDYQANTSLPPRFSIQQERIALYRKQHHESEWARFFREHQLEIRSRDYVSPKDSDRFIAYLHELFADVFLDMVNDNQELTRQDLEYCAMVILGFNTVQMTYCARVTSHSLHNRRYRMKEKLTPEWYILIFGTPK